MSKVSKAKRSFCAGMTQAIKAFKVIDNKVIAEKTGLQKVAKRAVFVADKAGNVVHVEAKRDPSQLPNFAKVKRAIGA
jgi:peroxiredoxin